MVPGDPRVLLKLATPRRYTDPDYMLTVGPDIYGGQLRLDRRRLEKHAAALRTGSSRGYLFQLLAGIGWTSWLWLPQFKLPVLIMMGADDPIVPVVNGRILASRLPDARLEVIDCGHLFILTHSEETARTIERFLLEVPADGAGRVSAVDLALPAPTFWPEHAARPNQGNAHEDHHERRLHARRSPRFPWPARPQADAGRVDAGDTQPHDGRHRGDGSGRNGARLDAGDDRARTDAGLPSQNDRPPAGQMIARRAPSGACQSLRPESMRRSAVPAPDA